MAVVVSSGSSTIAGTVSQGLGIPATGQTVITKLVAAAADGTEIHPVTAGKTFYCYGVSFGSTAAQTCGIKVAGTMRLQTNISANAPHLMSGGVLFSATTAQSITVYSAGGSMYVSIWGVEV